MDSQTRMDILTNVYSKMRGDIFTNNSQKVNLDKDHLDRVTASIIAPGPFYYFIFDCYKKESIYVNDTIGDFYPVGQKDFSIKTILEHIHPDDASHLFSCEAAAAEFLMQNIDVSDFPFYKVSHCYRITNKTGQYRMHLHQGVAFSLDSNGLMTQTMIVHTDIGHLTNENDMLFSLIGLNGRPSYIGINPYDRTNIGPGILKFTKRETEIIRLLANGMSSKLIAAELSIAPDTVRTHKQNMLKKSGVKNSNELVTMAIKLKVI